MLGVRVPPGLPFSFFRFKAEPEYPDVCGVDPMKSFFQKLISLFRNFIGFLKETKKELHNVSWPTLKEVRGTTIVVILAVFFFGGFLFVADIIVKTGIDQLYRLFSLSQR
jgi:preprotein translocase SecE subunit